MGILHFGGVHTPHWVTCTIPVAARSYAYGFHAFWSGLRSPRSPAISTHTFFHYCRFADTLPSATHATPFPAFASHATYSRLDSYVHLLLGFWIHVRCYHCLLPRHLFLPAPLHLPHTSPPPLPAHTHTFLHCLILYLRSLVLDRSLHTCPALVPLFPLDGSHTPAAGYAPLHCRLDAHACCLQTLCTCTLRWLFDWVHTTP